MEKKDTTKRDRRIVMKLPNDLIKATDYEKAKERVIHEFECVNGKFIQHYVLGGEHELTEEEVVDCLNALVTLDCDLSTAYAYIKGQNEKMKGLQTQLTAKDKALRLAVEIFCTGSHQDIKLAIKNMGLISGVVKYIEEQAEKELKEDKNGK